MHQKIIDFLIQIQQELSQQPLRKKAFRFKNGWMFSTQFNHFQKRNKEVYVYITPCLGLWKVQAYEKATMGICSLEAQIQDSKDLDKLFALAEEWLDTYQHGLQTSFQNPYSPFYKEGWQGRNLIE